MFRYINCRQCGEPFSPKYEWAKICLSCWISNKKKEESRQSNERFYKRQATKNDNLSSGLIDADKLKKLIFLCPPDKHGGSQTANEITVFLLSLKKKIF